MFPKKGEKRLSEEERMSARVAGGKDIGTGSWPARGWEPMRSRTDTTGVSGRSEGEKGKGSNHKGDHGAPRGGRRDGGRTEAGAAHITP